MNIFGYNHEHSCRVVCTGIFTAMHGMQMRSCKENSVCLTVRLSVKRVHRDKMK